MGRILFFRGIHAHQPVGYLPEILTQAYYQSYLSFLDILSQCLEVPFTLHHSGVLFDWPGATHLALLDRGGFYRAGTSGTDAGGYYEPILESLQEADKTG